MERFGSTSNRVFSVRSIFTFVLVVIITALLSITLGGQAAHAAEPTDASWSGDSIIHNGHGYSLTTNFTDPTNTIPDGATVYQTPPQTDDNGNRKVFILYFTSGVDPPSAKTAKYVEFTYTAAGLANPQGEKDVSLTVKGEEGEISSCSVSGIGWIICPVSVFLAEAMDNVFNILADMIKVQPSVLGDPNNSMYIAWNVMRNIANIAFVIAFLIIIYSQLSNFGVSNYGLKKLIPRLIIAAILVNVSFIVSAIAIDISNVLGYSIQNVFNSIRENVFNLTDDNFGSVNDNIGTTMQDPWAQLTAIVLAGGGVYAGVAYVSSGGLYMLIPLLLGLILTLIFVVIVLAARQAIIVILVIIAPLAFVANLLPNTEKWFDKWKDLFFTMLIFFPAFSLVFGGSQLAGQLIIQNAGGNLVTVIFGMAVQIAPLVITPLLLKFSGSLLGRIAQIANNPTKGVLDRNKNWASSRAEHAKQQNIAKGARWYNPASYGAGLVKNADFRKRRLQGRTEAFKQIGDNKYHETEGYEKIHTMAAGADLDKNKIQNRNEAHIERLKAKPGSSLYGRAEAAEASKEYLTATQNRTNESLNQRRVTPGSLLNQTTNTLEVSKETLEASQNRASEYLNQRRVTTGTALNLSSNSLEASKSMLETSNNEKAAYQNRQRRMAGTVLHSTVAPLETSKLNVVTAQSDYDTMVEGMKTNPVSGLYSVAQNAEASKEVLQASQANTQNLFDTQRRTVGTSLNLSTVQLETSKAGADASKTLTTAYVNDVRTDSSTMLHQNAVRADDAKIILQASESKYANALNNMKVDDTTAIHRSTVDAEKAKFDTQVSETRLSRMVEEYKSGQIDRSTLNAQDEAAMDAMFENTKLFSVEKQGVQSATYEGQQRVSEILASETPEADALLTIAGSVDENGKQRALATALAQRSRSRKETLGNIRSIFTFKNFSTATVAELAQGIPVPGINMSHDVKATALEMTLGGKDTAQVVEALKKVDFSFPDANDEQREELQILAYEALADSGSRPPYMTAGFMAMLKEGKDYLGNKFTGPYLDAGLNGLIGTAITREKLDSKKLQSAGKDYAVSILDAVKNDKSIDAKAKQRLLSELAVTLDPAREASEALGDSKGILYEIQDNIAVEAINDGTIDGRQLEVSSKEYAEAVLSTIRREGSSLQPAAKNTLLSEVKSLIQSGNATEIEPTLDKIVAELE